MSLEPEIANELVSAMAVTKKGLRASQGEGGHFYFVGDAKGKEGALIVFNNTKDATGKKTIRTGRSLLKTFRKGGVKPYYSQGTILQGSPMVFSIQKGTAKPAMIKLAFKKCTMLHEGVGSAMVGMLKSVKFQMGTADAPKGQPDQERDARESTRSQADRQQDMETWRRANAGLFFEMGEMTNEEIEDLYEAEKGFASYTQTLPRSLDEDTLLEERQADLESDLSGLIDGTQQLEALKETDLPAARALETQLNQQRVEMAQKIAIGGAPFDGGQLDDAEREALTVMRTVGAQLLIDRMQAIRDENARERDRIAALSGEEHDKAAETFEARRGQMLSEMDTIMQQLNALSSS